MNQICLYLSLLVYQASALVLPNKTNFPEHHLKRTIRHMNGHISSDDPAFMAVVIHDGCEKLCGGVFLTPKTILTLGNCVKKGKTKIKIYPNIPNYLPHCEEDVNVFPIAKIHFTPGYIPRAQHNDPTSLAIVYLQLPVDKVQTPSIKYAGNLGAKDATILYSLGIHKPTNISDIDDPDKCTLSKPKDAPVTCGSLGSEMHKCYLVPGLPIIVRDKGQTYLKGLLTDPIDCQTRTVLYVNVTSYSKWILSEIESGNGISSHGLTNGSLEMRSQVHKPIIHDNIFTDPVHREPFIPEPVQREPIIHDPTAKIPYSWPWPDEKQHTDNSKHDSKINEVGHGCICNCGQQRSNPSGPIIYNYDEEGFIPTERSNNNNNNNNDIHGDVHNQNQNNNEG